MNIAELLQGELKKQAMTQIAQKIWGDNKMAQSLIEKALPSILSWLEKNIQTADGKKSLDQALEKHTWESTINLSDGAKILGHIFGNNKESELEKIAKSSWVSKEQSADVMSLLSSLVMEKLGDQKKAGLGVDDITKMLSGSSKSAWLLKGFDQDGDGDVDKQDALKFGMNYIMKKFLGKK